MISKFNLANQSRKLLEKLDVVSQADSDVFSNEISDCISTALRIGTVSNSSDVSLYVTYVNFEDTRCYRFLYQIKTSVNGKIKNIDSVMSLIKDFEREFTYADKVNVVQESGVIFVDIFKKKKN